jgi:hypothetical protein
MTLAERPCGLTRPPPSDSVERVSGTGFISLHFFLLPTMFATRFLLIPPGRYTLFFAAFNRARSCRFGIPEEGQA